MEVTNPQKTWWTKVHLDLTKAATAAQKSFITPGVIIGFTEEDSIKTGYLIRLNDGSVGEYKKQVLGQKDFPTGVKLKSNLPEPSNVVHEPKQEVFAFEVLREQIHLLPKAWLYKNITALINGDSIAEPKEFERWILLPLKRKEDSELLNMLKTVAAYEGLRGLARFNDYVSYPI